VLPFTSKIETEHQDLLLLKTSEMESTQSQFAVKSEIVSMIGFVMISATKVLQVTDRENGLILL
jgi:hypothetical protein